MARITEALLLGAMACTGSKPPSSSSNPSSPTTPTGDSSGPIVDTADTADSGTTPTTAMTSYLGRPFGQAGYSLVALDWYGLPSLGVGAPTRVDNGDWGSFHRAETMGGFVLSAPFLGGVVQQEAIAGVAGVPYGWEIVTTGGGGGFGEWVSKADFDSDNVDDLWVHGFGVRGPFVGIVSPDDSDWDSDRHFYFECEVTGDGQTDLCFDGVVARPLPASIPRDVRETSWTASSYTAYTLAIGDLDRDSAEDVLLVADACVPEAEPCPVLGWNRTFDPGTWELEDVSEAVWTGGAVPQWGSTHADLDADGELDVVVAAPHADDGAGRAWILTDRTGGDLDTVAFATLTGEPDSQFGWELETGDLDGDGHDDLAIAGRDERVYVFRGPLPPGPLLAVNAPVILESPAPGDGFGFAMAASDFDQDGRTDLAIGAPDTPDPKAVGYGGSPARSGAVHIVWGGGL